MTDSRLLDEIRAMRAELDEIRKECFRTRLISDRIDLCLDRLSQPEGICVPAPSEGAPR